MFNGALVLALGEKGTIMKLEESILNGVPYVYYIHVKLEGQKHDNPYHPNDIAQLVPAKEADKI